MILVTGATGFIGRHLVKQLIADGRRIRCLLPEDKLKDLPWDNPPEIIVGNLLDEEVLFKAVTGVHTIIHLQSGQWWGRPRDLERIELVGTRNLITAARSTRVGRIITISQLGASSSSAYTLLRIKGMVEELIRSSGLAYTIIRSGIVFGEDDAFVNHIAMILRTNPVLFLMPGQGEVVLHPIYIDDLIVAVSRSLELIDVVDTTIDVGGPEYIGGRFNSYRHARIQHLPAGFACATIYDALDDGDLQPGLASFTDNDPMAGYSGDKSYCAPGKCL
jgi:uncharacterized protein YbjT (DUF2867 family)